MCSVQECTVINFTDLDHVLSKANAFNHVQNQAALGTEINAIKKVTEKNRAPNCYLKASLHFTSVIFCNIFHQINHKHTGSWWWGCPMPTCPQSEGVEAVQTLGKVHVLRILEGDRNGLQQVQFWKTETGFSKKSSLLIYICKNPRKSASLPCPFNDAGFCVLGTFLCRNVASAYFFNKNFH